MKCKLEKDQGKLVLDTLQVLCESEHFETLKLTFCKDSLFIKDFNVISNIKIDISYPITIFSEPPSSEITIDVNTKYLKNAIKASKVKLDYAKGLEIELEYPHLNFITLDSPMRYRLRCNEKTEPRKLELDELERSAKNLNIEEFDMGLRVIDPVYGGADANVLLTLLKNKLKMLAESEGELSTSDVSCECEIDKEVCTAVRRDGLNLIKELSSKGAERMDLYMVAQGIIVADLFYPYNARAVVTLATAITNK